jgi:hypothetical protein
MTTTRRPTTMISLLTKIIMAKGEKIIKNPFQVIKNTKKIKFQMTIHPLLILT